MRTVQAGLLLVGLLGMFALGWVWRGDRAERAALEVAAQHQKAVAAAVARARETDATVRQETVVITDVSEAERERIHEEYEQRLRDARAGHDGELGRLRQQWGACETSRLADGAAAAGATAEEDRLRRESAARIVRACELAQSERDEVIDRYEAVRRTFDGSTTE